MKRSLLLGLIVASSLQANDTLMSHRQNAQAIVMQDRLGSHSKTDKDALVAKLKTPEGRAEHLKMATENMQVMGVGGATAGMWLGKFLTHVAFQTAIALSSVAVGAGTTFITGGNVAAGAAAAKVAWTSLELTLAPVAEATSNVVALGTGIAGATLTGPV